jgi:hypothetical protein
MERDVTMGVAGANATTDATVVATNEPKAILFTAGAIFLVTDAEQMI